MTGKTLTEAEQAQVKYQIRRAMRKLENLLGFTLDPKKINTNIYNELGKADSYWGWSYPNVDISKLLPPDEVIGSYRLYTFNWKDEYFHVDPFEAVHNVKLVYIRKGYPDEQGITAHTFDFDEVRPHYGKDGIGKYIERVRPWWFDHRKLRPDEQLQLAVDADWVWQDCLPDDLKWMIIDMVEAAIDPKGNIRSESIEGHSYSKYDKVVPETEPHNQTFLSKFAGPDGSASRIPTI